MDISKDYICSEGSDAAIILLLGSGGNNILTKGVSKWLVKQGVNVFRAPSFTFQTKPE